MNPLQSLPDYEQFIYTLSQRYTAIDKSTLTVARRSSFVAIMYGELQIGDYRLTVREILSFGSTDISPITHYGYEVWKGSQKLYWYDSQPHPNNPALAENHPHHKHIPPNIKRNRIPAPALSFERPNLPFLIEEIVQLTL